MQELELALSKIAKGIESKKQYITTEATTISTLIDPFIQALQYDTTDPSQVIREYDADSRLKKGDKIDIAIIKNSKPIIFIECKKLGENLNAHVGQLNSYFVAVPELNYAILTNGVEYRFYKESKEKSNTMDLKPFLEIDLNKSISHSQLQTLFTFNREQFDQEKLNNIIDIFATEKAVKQFMNKLINSELSADDEFINIIIKETPFKGKKGENREIFAQLTSKFIKIWLDEHLRDRINNMAKQQEETQQEIVKESQILTTEDEIQSYYIIKSICSEKVESHKIQFQDYQGFFSVYYDNRKTKHICKLYLTDKKKEIEIEENKRILFKNFDDLYLFKKQLFEKLAVL